MKNVVRTSIRTTSNDLGDFVQINRLYWPVSWHFDAFSDPNHCLLRFIDVLDDSMTIRRSVSVYITRLLTTGTTFRRTFQRFLAQV
jgi:hypothetical protein